MSQLSPREWTEVFLTVVTEVAAEPPRDNFTQLLWARTMPELQRPDWKDDFKALKAQYEAYRDRLKGILKSLRSNNPPDWLGKAHHLLIAVVKTSVEQRESSYRHLKHSFKLRRKPGKKSAAKSTRNDQEAHDMLADRRRLEWAAFLTEMARIKWEDPFTFDSLAFPDEYFGESAAA